MNGTRQIACAVLTMGLATCMIVLVSYCRKQKLHEHKNVITGVGTIGHNRILLLDDTETNKERFYVFSKGYDVKVYDDLKLDDTVTIITGGNYVSDKHYKNSIILKDADAGIHRNVDNIYAHKKYRNYNYTKNTKQK